MEEFALVGIFYNVSMLNRKYFPCDKKLSFELSLGNTGNMSLVNSCGENKHLGNVKIFTKHWMINQKLHMHILYIFYWKNYGDIMFSERCYISTRLTDKKLMKTGQRIT